MSVAADDPRLVVRVDSSSQLIRDWRIIYIRYAVKIWVTVGSDGRGSCIAATDEGLVSRVECTEQLAVKALEFFAVDNVFFFHDSLLLQSLTTQSMRFSLVSVQKRRD